MLFGTQDLFSGTIAADGTRSAQAITATAISTNVIDLRQPNGAPALVDNGIGLPSIWLTVQVIQAFNTLTSLTITLESDSAAALNVAPVVHFSTGAILLANLTANTVLVRAPYPSTDYKRYLGLRYTVTGANPTLGSVIAFQALDVQRTLNYPSGFTSGA